MPSVLSYGRRVQNSRVHFRLLGSLEVEVEGSVVPLTGRQRSLCTVLLLSANRVVSVERIVSRLWEDHPPVSGAARVRSLVTEVRRALGPVGARLVVTQSPGYVIRVGPDGLDLLAFESLIKNGTRAAAAGGWNEAFESFERALTLWRGDPHPDLSAPAEQFRLDELRITAVEGRAEAGNMLGRDRSSLAELARLVAEHPLRERPHALFMTALHKAGRTGEAMAVYAGLRKRMIVELGVEPTAELRELHRRLLGGTGGARTGAAPAGRFRGYQEHGSGAGAAGVIPRQLPAATHRFVGRADSMRRMDEALAAAEPVVLLVGAAGVGKTALALHWSHLAARHFPDGQLYLDMRGFHDSPPMAPEEAVPMLLQGLGCRPPDIPTGLDAQTALYRTLLADRRVLIVLDDVADPSQVRPLLPGTSRSLTLVTSRDRLDGLVALDSAHRLTCGVLDSAEALDLIRAASGPARVAAEPQAAARLAALCDFLPLALCVATSWIGDREPNSIGAYVRALADRGRLARLYVEGDRNVAVRAALDLSYEALPAHVRRAFRLLGLMPGKGFSAAAAAAVTGVDRRRLEELLRPVVRLHLLRETWPGRFTWDDLVHEYAGQRAAAEDSRAERKAAVRRLLDHYLHGIVNATEACGLYLPRQPAGAAVAGANPRTFTCSADAYAWFDAEWQDIAAVVVQAAEQGPRPYAGRLVGGLRKLLHHRLPRSEWIRLTEHALAAAEAEAAGDPAVRTTVPLPLRRAALRAAKGRPHPYDEGPWPLAHHAG